MTTLAAVGLPPASTSATIGPVISRVGGLPVDVLQLVSPEAREQLALVIRLRRELEQQTQDLVDALFALVPRLDDDVRLRRRVLAGKRAAHHGEPLPWDDDTWQNVLGHLTEGESRLAATYRSRHDALAAATSDLDVQVAADTDHAITGLCDALHDGDYLTALAVAAPDWLAHARPQERRPTSTTALKTLYAYTVRAALKTSPFSGLTLVGAAGQPGEGRWTSRVSTTLAARALQTLARDRRTAPLLRLRLAPHHAGDSDALAGLLLRSETLLADGIVWRNDRAVPADHALPWLECLDGIDPLTVAAIADRVDTPDPFVTYLRLLDTGIVAVEPPWRRDEEPLAVLADLVDGHASPIAADDLRRVHELGRQIACLGVAARVRAAQVIGEVSAPWGDRADLGAHAASGAVYEDRETAATLFDPLSAPAVRHDLDSLAATMRPFVFRSHVYDLLVSAFVTRYGRGGRCSDTLGFLMCLAAEQDTNPALLRAQSADLAHRGQATQRAQLPVGATSAPPSAGVLFQLAADSEREVGAGDYDLVVNHFSAGSGALSARFASLLGQQFRDALRHYVRAGWGARPCRELLVWTDCNNAQAQASGLLPPLLLPGEPRAPQGLDLRDTVLRHDPADDTLSLLDDTGEPFGLVYLGLTPQHLLQGYVKLLAALANPWINGSTASDYTPLMSHELLRDAGDEVVAHPRRTSGRIVTRRASWVVPVGALPRPSGTKVGADVLLELRALQERHGMPDEVFVHRLSSGMGALVGDHKPTWLAFGSALSASALWQWLDDGTTHLRLVEALPSTSQHPQRAGDGRRHVTEHAAFLRWDRPGAGS